MFDGLINKMSNSASKFIDRTFSNDNSSLSHKTRTGVTGSNNKNPYAPFYSPITGYIFGRPVAFNYRADPNHRVFQRTMLRNGLVLTIVPGVPFADKNMVKKANDIMSKYSSQLASAGPDSVSYVTAKVQKELNDAKCDLRFLTFKKDIASFQMAYQQILNRASVSLFGVNALSMKQTLAFNEDSKVGGYRLWIEKGTSVSESIDNSFTNSILEQGVKKASGLAKELRFANIELGMLNLSEMGDGEEGERPLQTAEGNIVNDATSTTSKVLSALSGSSMQFPQMFDDSKFNRSYDISFRFMSPAGDDQSVFWHVITPFLFLLTCAAPRQDGITGHTSPFILQLDAPGYFSCPMGVVTSFSFRKGGDEAFFNRRGLPLVIEGTMNVMDLYSALALPMRADQLAVNFGTSAFLDNLVGLNIYNTYDRAMLKTILDGVSNMGITIMQPFKNLRTTVMDASRLLGMDAGYR